MEQIYLAGTLVDLPGDNGASFWEGTIGNDVINASSADDMLTDKAGNDSLLGSAGSDLLNGGLGNDVLNGGLGIDTASYADATKGVSVYLALATAHYTNDGRDTLVSIENIAGSRVNDGLRGDGNANVLDGALGNDNLFGFGGSDTLVGGAGNDNLQGGDGSDTLKGGVGRDTLTGGGGDDTFVFDTLTATPEPDTIRDFGAGLDQIALSTAVFTALSGSTLAASEFHIGARATTVDQHIIYNAATGALFYDVDGLGGAAQTKSRHSACARCSMRAISC